MEIQPIHSEKKPIYEEPIITQEEDDYKTLFGDDQEIKKIVEKIQEKEHKKKKDYDLMITKQEQELVKEKIQNLKQQLTNKSFKSKINFNII
jgi:hypothetical protein